MKHLKLLAGCGVLAALASLLASTALAAGGGPTVTIRVEGLKRTLLGATKTKVHPGWVTRYGAPTGMCPDKSAEGALDIATKHRWVGKWSTEFGPEYEITSILGEKHRLHVEVLLGDLRQQQGGLGGRLRDQGDDRSAGAVAAVPGQGRDGGAAPDHRPRDARLGGIRSRARARPGRRRTSAVEGVEVTGGGVTREP